MGAISSGKVQADVQPTSTLTPSQQALSNGLIGSVGQSLQGPANVYPGQRVAGASPLQQQAFQWSSMMPGKVNTLQNMGIEATRQAAQPMNYDALMGQATNLWNRTIMPSILNQQGGMDQAGGGGTTDALSRAGVDLSTNLMAQIAPLELQARGQQLQAGQQYGNLAMMPFAGISALSDQGAAMRGLDTEFLQSEQARWAEGQMWGRPETRLALNLLPQSGQQMENVVSQQPRSIWDWTKGVFG